MSVFLHYFQEIFFLSNYHCVLYTTAIELLFARIRGHCALYWRPSRPAFWTKGLVTSRVSLRCQKKTLKRQITNFFYDKNSFTAISQIFCKLPYQQNIYNHETALKNSATSKDQQFLLQCISFCSFFISSLLLGRCDNQLFRNPAKFGPQIYTVLCNTWLWFGAKPCWISAVHTYTIDRNLTHDATFRWALS